MSTDHEDIAKLIAANLILNDAAPQGVIASLKARQVMNAQGLFQGHKVPATQNPWRSCHCAYKPETANGFYHNCQTKSYRITAYSWLEQAYFRRAR